MGSTAATIASSTAVLQANAAEKPQDQAEALFNSGQFIEATRSCAAAIDANPNDHAPYLVLGRLAELVGDDQRAAEYFSEAIVRNVECGIAFAHLSRIFRKRGQLPHAARSLQVAMEMNAAGPEAQLDLADMLFEMGDSVNARLAYQAVLEAHPDCSRSKAILKLLGAAPNTRPAPAPQTRWTIPSGWNKVHISIVAPAGNPHWQGFAKTAESFSQALAELGIETSLACNEMLEDRINIVFGAHLMSSHEAAHKIPAGSVIFNLEQISGFGLDRYPVYKNIVSRFVVWDYSPRNIEKLKELSGKSNIVHINVGYTPNLTCVPQTADQTTDVLFYGSLNARRDAVLDEIRSYGINVKHLFNVYGKELDSEVANAKVVLNMHFYEDSIHEIVRTSYLMANRKAIVSECNLNTEIEPDILTAMRPVPYNALALTCKELVRNATERSLLEAAAFQSFSRRSQSRYLMEAITETMRSTSSREPV
ncbi:MAG: tetratricopeptide repeat protein [Hyphomicrobium sp.]